MRSQAERGVGLAARRLEVTPSAVSHGLHKLRTLFNDELFLRAGTAMKPTVRAQALFEPVRRLGDQNDPVANRAAHAAIPGQSPNSHAACIP
ncbi:MAG: LysR family transcriptional regulator [Pseudomonadota bacterium]|nr:LysR family transcriptional regulator [Pseudomonadota bacterium]